MPDTSIKVVVLGGSSVGTPELVDSLKRFASSAFSYELVLHGRTPSKLEPVARVAQQMAQGCDWLRVTSTTDLAQALDGAQYVINQVRVGGLAARAFDETYPIQFGIPGEETVGPGGFANSLRTVPTVIRLVQEIERHAPDALLLSFTNPASVIQYAITQTSKLRVIGLCDGPVSMTKQAAIALGLEDSSTLSVDYVGMHHFGFITRVIRDGRDETQAMLDGLDRIPNLDMDPDFVRSLGALPTPYFRYFIQPDRILEHQRHQEQSRAEQLLTIENDLLSEYATAKGRPVGLSRRSAKWYDAIIAPVLVTLAERRTARMIVNVQNLDTQAWLPSDAIIETPCLFEAGQARPLSITPPEREIRARVQLNCAFEQLMVEAILEQSEAKAMRALVMNPMVQSIDTARRILKLIWPSGDAAGARDRP